MPLTFLSKEVAVLGVGFLLSGFVAWNDVTTDVQSNTTKIEEQEKFNKERHEDLKEGQRRIQDLLDKLLQEKRDSG